MKPTISIIIPILNTREYVEECLDSIRRQTYRDFEVLVIDAGSTDGSLEIVCDFVSKDSRFNLIHSERKSYGYQVNLGITMAKGSYIGVVEPDDYIDPVMYEKLYMAIDGYSIDYVKGSHKAFARLPNGYDYFVPSLVLPEGIFGNHYGRIELVPMNYPELHLTDGSIWAGLYKAEFMRKIHLNESEGAAYQDVDFIIQQLTYSKKAAYIEDYIYYYRVNNISASGYNRKCFSYLLTEYDVLDRIFKNPSMGWKKTIETKLYRQIFDRIRIMAFKNEIWDEAKEPLKKLQDRINKANTNLDLKKDFKEQEIEYFDAFLFSFMDLYKLMLEDLQEKKKKFKELLLPLVGKDVIIYGAGERGKKVALLLLASDQCRNICFCDDNAIKQNMVIFGVSVLDFVTANDIYSDAMFIVAEDDYKDQSIINYIVSFGVNKNRIHTYNDVFDMLFLIFKE